MPHDNYDTEYMPFERILEVQPYGRKKFYCSVPNCVFTTTKFLNLAKHFEKEHLNAISF
jgi:hypothetical protein